MSHRGVSCEGCTVCVVLLRSATVEDLPAVVSMAHSMKRQLAEWSPQYFRPRDGAEELHAAYLEFLVSSEDHETQVVVDDRGGVVGFFHVVTQPRQRWVDDLYLSREALRPALAPLHDMVAKPWVTCVSYYDDVRAAALGSAGLEAVSTFWARALDATQSSQTVEVSRPPHVGPEAARHVFGSGEPFDPSSPDALVVADEDGGYAIGSPGVEPPLYDPGGPSCVVDRIHGSNRRSLLDAAMGTAAARGDAGMIVVCDQHDDQLRDVLLGAGFRAEVNLFASF